MKAVPALVRAKSNGEDGVECVPDEAIVGVAPGQVVAVYMGERCIGSGVIDETLCEDEDEVAI